MRPICSHGLCNVILLVCWINYATCLLSAEPAAWKVGVASIKITPENSMWMAGYASRKSPSAGVMQDLYAKALAIEDEAGQRLVIMTFDLIGVPRELRDKLAAAAKEQFGLSNESLLLNASHTHCGPELRMQRVPLEGSPEEVEKRLALALEYSANLREKLLALLGSALQSMAPAQLDYQFARCGFAMNRRRPSEGGYINSSYPDGPIDHTVPVLRVTAPEGKLRALLFGYACHNTTLGFDFFCGDYAGYAQEYLQADHPEVTALFMTGCGGDQNPYPRSKLELAQQHGRALANAVDAAMTTVPRPVRGPLRVRYGEVSLDFAPPPSREQLETQAAGTREPIRSHARRLLKQLDESGKIVDTYKYPIQVVGFGKDLLLVALAGETVVDYSLRLKQELAGSRPVWVAGYSNDVFGYVPSLRVLREGGYEGGEAMLWGALPGPFAPSVEERIMEKVRSMVEGL